MTASNPGPGAARVPPSPSESARAAVDTFVAALVRRRAEQATSGQPDIVYTHYPTDQHLDHMATAHEVTAVALREAANLTYFRSPYSVGFDPNMIFMGTSDLLKAKKATLGCFASQQQLDMTAFTKPAQVVHRQHVHHRVVERLPPHAVTAELFTIARRVEITTDAAVTPR